eukprot:tig00021590_g22772.t1
MITGTEADSGFGARGGRRAETAHCAFKMAVIVSSSRAAVAFSAAALAQQRASLVAVRSPSFFGSRLRLSAASTMKGRGSWPSSGEARFSVLASGERKRVVFLGTPPVAARSLEVIMSELESQSVAADVVGVVSQPPAASGRGQKLVNSAVHALALERGLPVLTPPSARDEAFLEELRSWRPDLCVTAAYGCVLPDAFLSIPPHGTLNIHPSLLPLYRGAAPVPRCVEKGDAETGVTVLLTVKKMDAGPILAQERIPMPEDMKAPELLELLFDMGSRLLVRSLPSVFDGSASFREQEDAQVSHAAKLSSAEATLSFAGPARALHNKVKAFAGWPGTKTDLEIAGERVNVKIVTTRCPAGAGAAFAGAGPLEVALAPGGDALQLRCDDGSVLEVLELQLPSKKVTDARSFWNGFKAKGIRRPPSSS